MVEFSEQSIEVNGARVRLRVAGAGKPVIYLGSGGAMPATVSALAQHARMLAFEPAGVDENAARALAAAVATLGHVRFGVVASASCAPLALWLGIAAPEVVEAIVLIAPSVLDADGVGPDPSLIARLGGLKAHVLALFGTRDTASPPTLGRLYRKKIPNCHLVFVYDAGHDIEGERPAAAAAVMRDFLERREQFVVSTKSGKIYP